ncbi:MAG: cysteine desulfurase family protein [Eubacteriales bacterium]|nr:cysteine desulfurase family protein [Eubacteriales bacterium]
MIYLDNSATTKPLPEAIEAFDRASTEGYFNPASAYGPSVEAERKLERARATLAKQLEAGAEELVFTSGGTESNNAAIFGALKAARGRGRIITTKVEHPSVYEVFRMLEGSGYDVAYLDVNQYGAVNIQSLQDALTADTQLVSMMQVNNETGAINPIAEAYAAIKKQAPQALLHVDGVQGFLKSPITAAMCDMYTISAHKFHGLKGVGALYVKKSARFAGGQIGGGQERGLRSGTVNVPGILGMEAAIRTYQKNHDAWLNNMQACKTRLYKELISLNDVLHNGPTIEDSAPHILNMSFLGVRGEVLLHALEQKEIYVSTGSACSTHKKGKNRILSAMGVEGERQEGAIRFSLCPFNTVEEMDTVSEVIADTLRTLRKFKRR